MAAGNDGAGATPGVGTMFAPKVFTCMLEQAVRDRPPSLSRSPPAPGAHVPATLVSSLPFPPVSPRVPDGDVGACPGPRITSESPTLAAVTSVWVQGSVVWTDGRGRRRRASSSSTGSRSTTAGPPLRIATPPSCHCASTRDRSRGGRRASRLPACVRFAPNEGGRVTTVPTGGAGSKRRAAAGRAPVLTRRGEVHDLSREGTQEEAMWNVEVPEAFKTLEAAHAAG